MPVITFSKEDLKLEAYRCNRNAFVVVRSRHILAEMFHLISVSLQRHALIQKQRVIHERYSDVGAEREACVFIRPSHSVVLCLSLSFPLYFSESLWSHDWLRLIRGSVFHIVL